jgi:alkaline phosphatase D
LHNPKLLRLMLERKPAAALFYGDIAVDDRDNNVGRHRSDYLLRDLSPAWREFAANVPVCATWDDHDYFNNDKKGIPPGFTDADRRAVRQVWTQNWNNPSYGFGDEGGGIFCRTRIGPADIIMVDNRYFRGGSTTKTGRFLGAEQTRWLERHISGCRSPFLLLTCGTMWSDYVSAGKDSWGVTDTEGRERLFQLMEGMKGALPVFLSGDRHGARGFRIPRPSGRTLHEFNSALLGGHHGPPARMENCPEQVFGFERLHAFSELELDTTGSEPIATYRLIHQDGAELVRIVLGHSLH